MRILHSLEGTSWSGGQQQALFLAKGQKELGHDLLLMCQSGSELEARAKKLAIPVLPNDYQKELHPGSILRLLRAFNFFKPEIVNVHRAWAHTQWVLVSLLKRFSGLIVTRRVLFKPDSNPLSLIKYRTPAVKGYIAVSNSVALRLRQLGISRKRIRVVYSATDTDYFNPGQLNFLETDYPFDKKDEIILLIGNFHFNKGHILLVEAFELIASNWPNARLFFAGTATNSGELFNRVKTSSQQSRIHLLGFRKDIPSLLSRACISVNASFEEGFSGTLRESLSMGVISVASDIPSNLELNEHVPLILFKSGSSADLARALLLAREQIHEEHYRLSLRQKVVQTFSVTAMVNRTTNIYREFLRENKYPLNNPG